MKWCENYQNEIQTQSEQMLLGKNGAHGLAWSKVATNLQLKKKVQYLWSIIKKKSAIKQGVSVWGNFPFIPVVSIFLFQAYTAILKVSSDIVLTS